MQHHSENSDSYGIRQVLANWILTVEMPTDVVAFVVSIVVIFITWKVVRLTVRAVMAIVWPMILFTLLLVSINNRRKIYVELIEWGFECVSY